MKTVLWTCLCLAVCVMLLRRALGANDVLIRENDEDGANGEPPTRSKVQMFNFAAQGAGAVVLDKSPASAKGYHNLLNDDKDKYGISPCEEKKWVVIGLSEEVLITAVEVANYEKYSSMLKDFQLLASTLYPTDEWINLGSYTALPQLGAQSFNITELSGSHTRYLKVKFQSHYSNEALCTLSQIKVYGMTVIASFQQEVERSDSHLLDMRDMMLHLNSEAHEEDAQQIQQTQQDTQEVGSAEPVSFEDTVAIDSVTVGTISIGDTGAGDVLAHARNVGETGQQGAEGSDSPATSITAATTAVESSAEGVDPRTEVESAPAEEVHSSVVGSESERAEVPGGDSPRAASTIKDKDSSGETLLNATDSPVSAPTVEVISDLQKEPTAGVADDETELEGAADSTGSYRPFQLAEKVKKYLSPFEFNLFSSPEAVSETVAAASEERTEDVSQDTATTLVEPTTGDAQAGDAVAQAGITDSLPAVPAGTSSVDMHGDASGSAEAPALEKTIPASTQIGEVISKDAELPDTAMLPERAELDAAENLADEVATLLNASAPALLQDINVTLLAEAALALPSVLLPAVLSIPVLANSNMVQVDPTITPQLPAALSQKAPLNVSTGALASSANNIITNGSALNCFENLSFAEFSRKMRAKLQQKSANSTGNGTSTDTAEAALATAAGVGKDNNVFRALMQKIKTLEMNNAIVEMYTIQMSECYKSVTKDLLARTQDTPILSNKYSYGAERAGYAHADLLTLLSLLPKILLHYTQARDVGLLDTFAVLLRAFMEDHVALLICGLMLSLMVMGCGLITLAVILLRLQARERLRV